jgi:hypothetical protein
MPLHGYLVGPSAASMFREWEQALAASTWSWPDVWVHGDLPPGDLLISHRLQRKSGGLLSGASLVPGYGSRSQSSDASIFICADPDKSEGDWRQV